MTDLLGLETELIGKSFGWDVELNSDISTFNPENIADGSRIWGGMKKNMFIRVNGRITLQMGKASFHHPEE